MSENIVDQLVRGSKNIDRMRQEIDHIVYTLIGLVGTSPSLNPVCEGARVFVEYYALEARPRFQRIFPSTRCIWSVTFGKNGSNVTVNCVTSPEDANYSTSFEERVGAGRIYTSYDDSRVRREACRMKDVKTIHDALPALMGGMAEIFPGLTERWQPFIDAAT